MPAQPKPQTVADEMRGLLARLQEEQQRRLAETDAELKQREHQILRLQELITDSEGPGALPLLSVASGGTLALVATKPRKTKPHKRSDHPFPQKVNVKQWAEKAGLSYTYVKSWYSTNKLKRHIPRKWALQIRKEHGIPLESWPNGITDREPGWPHDAD